MGAFNTGFDTVNLHRPTAVGVAVTLLVDPAPAAAPVRTLAIPSHFLPMWSSLRRAAATTCLSPSTTS